MELPHALKDAQKTIELDPSWVKGYLRKANCLVAMQKTQEAIDVYNEALKVAPDNAEAKAGISNAYRARMSAQAGMSSEERAEAAVKNDPEVQQILQDPIMNQILQQMQKDPASVQSHMQNPEIARKIQKLVQAGVLQMR
jgi:stress-induced-phosphoprotein 1